MKKIRIVNWKGGVIAVLSLGVLLSDAQASKQASKQALAARPKEESKILLEVPPPPLPPVFFHGRWIPWEEVFGEPKIYMELDLTKLQAIRKREFRQQRTKTHLLHVFRLHPLLYKKMKVNNRGPFQKEVWARILKPFLFQSSPVSLNLSIKPQSLSLLKNTSSKFL